MKSPAYIWYGGFRTKPTGREYLFWVENEEKEPREFRLTIDDEVWLSNDARHQDGPAVCGHRLLRKLVKSSDHSSISDYLIAATELEEYRAALLPRGSDGK